MPDKLSILVVGASGLVGQGVLRTLLQEPAVETVGALVRHTWNPGSSKVRVIHTPDYEPESLNTIDLGGFHACFYCAGPLPIGMSVSSYRSATVDSLRNVVSQYARSNPQGYVIYISGLGASIHSRLMPLRVKGEAEQVLRNSGVAYTAIRPGIINPVLEEKSPHAMRRVLYTIGKPALAVGCLIAPQIFTTSRALGKCMLALVLAGAPYPEVVENAALKNCTSH